MKMDLPQVLVIELAYNTAQRLMELGSKYRRHNATVIKHMVQAAPTENRAELKALFKRAISWNRKLGNFK